MENREIWILIIVCIVVYGIFAASFLFLKKRLKNTGTIHLAILLPIALGFITGVSILLYAISCL